MADTNEDGVNQQINPVVAGVAGVIIGASVGAATTKVLSDKKTRDRVAHTVSRVRTKIADSVKQARNEMKEKKEMAQEEGQKTR